MKSNRLNLNQQWQLSVETIEKCRKHESELKAIRREATAIKIEYAERVREVGQAAELERDQKKDAVVTDADRQKHQAQQATQQHLNSVSEQHRQTLHGLTSQTEQQLSDLEERRKQESWILNSVLDKNTTDSPVVECGRVTEAFIRQHESFQETHQLTHKSIQKAADYLLDCHAASGPERPAPTVPKLKLDELKDSAISDYSNALECVHRLYKFRMPSVVRGLRIWGLSLLAFFILWIPVIAIQEDLNQYINPDLGDPNTKWLATSAAISFGIVGFVALMLILNVQGKLRGLFAEACQSVSNADAAAAEWEKRSARRIKKLEATAKQFEVEVQQQRQEKQQLLAQTIDDQISSVRQHASEMTAGMTQQLHSATVAAEQHLQATVQAVEQNLQQQIDQIFHDHDRDLQQQLSSLEELHVTSIAELNARDQEVSGQWHSDVQQLQNLASESRNIATPNRLLPPLNNSWQLPAEIPSFAPLGDLLASVVANEREVTESAEANPAAAAIAADVKTRTLCVEMPAVLPFPSEMSICVQHDASGRDAAVSFLRRQLLTAVTNLPPGRFRLTLIDPIGLGQSFSALMHLADYDEMLIYRRIFTESRQIREQLQKVTEHMENVFQTYLRSEFDSIEQYNESAGEVAEPYHFVVVAGFPNAFTEESAMALSSILTSGPRCGVHAMVAWNPVMDPPTVFDTQELIHHCANFVVRDGQVQFSPAPPAVLPDVGSQLVFESTREPATKDYVQYVRRIGDLSKNARRVEVSFSRIAPTTDRIWTHSTADGIDLPIGRAGAARLQYMRLGRGTSQHVLVAGKTGSGKSTFLHILITNLALHYGPNELQFYLIDFKKGVEFRTYAANHLPHARVVAIESDREFGLSVLERLDQVLQERGELFRERGVQDVPAFRSQFPDERMPRLLLLIDEFQEFFVSEDRVSSRASLLLDRLVRQGRAFGVHVLLGSQTLGGAYSLARSTMGQIAVRIALQCSENDAHLILSEDNSAARLLTRPGEAIYNDANGLVQGNNTFQIAWLEDERRQQAIEDMNTRPLNVSSERPPMIVFEGNIPPVAEKCGPLNVWLNQSPDATTRSFDGLDIWLGEPLAIAPPTQIQLRRAGGQNVVVIGQDEKMVNSLLAFTMLSVAFRPSFIHSKNTVSNDCRMMMLLDRTDTEMADELLTLSQRCGSDRLIMGTTSDVAAMIDEVTEELNRREQSAEHSSQPTWVLAIRNIGQFRDLRKAEDDFGMGGFGEAKEATTASKFGDVIKRGPNVGIHVVVWSDTFSNAVRWMSNSLLREFETRIAFRMNQTDSSSFIDSPIASGLENGRAIIYRDQTGTTEKFRPFAWPQPQWLDQLAIESGTLGSYESSRDEVTTHGEAENSADPPSATGPDIDSLTIE